MNHANYVESCGIRDRLWATIDVLSDLGTRGMVLHANQTRPARYWTPKATARIRDQFISFIVELKARIRGAPIWVGLENMPVTGNTVDEYDPILVYGDDYRGICSENLGITWDLCHYSYTLHMSQLILTGEVALRDHNHARECTLSDGWSSRESIFHLHFAGFRGVATESGGCIEGMLPWDSSLGSDYYAELLKEASAELPNCSSVTFEVTESDYAARKNFPAMAKWADMVLDRA